ncbi:MULTISPECIES: hypothetical protein [unclassified Mycoplasma]|uniref:hypothetical protein n=1 Tax=unclassified Mycoplasma TaxID=2683645 RepID=UPI00211C4FE2|nr:MULTISPECIES: hypothetical protein [unclassified Mycoplasma]UUM19510.1 hypothetical protein NPA11_01875 [Mycoplasma sp. 1578d]UUM25133.1 hypothetical protein NPA12_01850 [Mycoplasma sp. 3686d]
MKRKLLKSIFILLLVLIPTGVGVGIWGFYYGPWAKTKTSAPANPSTTSDQKPINNAQPSSQSEPPKKPVNNTTTNINTSPVKPSNNTISSNNNSDSTNEVDILDDLNDSSFNTNSATEVSSSNSEKPSLPNNTIVKDENGEVTFNLSLNTADKEKIKESKKEFLGQLLQIFNYIEKKNFDENVKIKINFDLVKKDSKKSNAKNIQIKSSKVYSVGQLLKASKFVEFLKKFFTKVKDKINNTTGVEFIKKHMDLIKKILGGTLAAGAAAGGLTFLPGLTTSIISSKIVKFFVEFFTRA